MLSDPILPSTAISRARPARGGIPYLRLLGGAAGEHEPGIFGVAGLPFATWLVETDVMAERGQPVLSLDSVWRNAACQVAPEFC